MYVQWPAEKAISPKNTGKASSETQRKHYILLTKKEEKNGGGGSLQDQLGRNCEGELCR
jgi:hypothetical protein